MNILTIRTDKVESELGLYYQNEQIDYVTWDAHRMLAETLHFKIEALLSDNNKSFSDIDGIICYKGPGSFTGLRIGISVANALSHSLKVPIIGIQGEDDWINRGLALLLEGSNDKIVIPEYGAPVHITKPKK